MKNKNTFLYSSVKTIVTAMVLILFSTVSIMASGQQETVSDAQTSEEQYVIKLAHTNSTSDPLHPTSEKFKELAEAYTNGRVKVEIYPNGQLGDEQEIVQALRTGAIEMGLNYTGNIQSLAPSIGVLMLPYMFKSSEEAWHALDAILPSLNERLIQEAGIRALGFCEKGFRVLTNSKKPVETLEDLRGLKIRVSPSEVPIKTFKAWGIDPIPMAWGEVFTALQQGVIDGQENPYTTIPAFQFDEVQKYITEIHYMLWTGPFLISERVFTKLPGDIQQELTKAAVDASKWEREFASSLKDDAIEKCEAAGMILSGPPKDESEWQAKAQSIWPDFYDSVGGKAWVDEALKIMFK